MSGPISEFRATRPDDIEMTLTIRQTLAAWREVRAVIEASGKPTHYGALGVVCQAIDSMVRQAERTWVPEKPT